MTNNTDREFVIERPEVAAVFDSYDDDIRAELLHLRQPILDTAEKTEGVGTIDEVLKWGEPSYLTTHTRSGSTIRIAPTRAGHRRGEYAYDRQQIAATKVRRSTYSQPISVALHRGFATYGLRDACRDEEYVKSDLRTSLLVHSPSDGD